MYEAWPAAKQPTSSRHERYDDVSRRSRKVRTCRRVAAWSSEGSARARRAKMASPEGSCVNARATRTTAKCVFFFQRVRVVRLGPGPDPRDPRRPPVVHREGCVEGIQVASVRSLACGQATPSTRHDRYDDVTRRSRKVRTCRRVAAWSSEGSARAKGQGRKGGRHMRERESHENDTTPFQESAKGKRSVSSECNGQRVHCTARPPRATRLLRVLTVSQICRVEASATPLPSHVSLTLQFLAIRRRYELRQADTINPYRAVLHLRYRRQGRRGRRR